MKEDRSCEDAFVSAPGLLAVLGGSRSGIYRLIDSLKQKVTITRPNGEKVEIWAIPELGGLRLPGNEWTFERAEAEAFRALIMREARKARRAAKMDGNEDG
jgi:hypothetical protein